jgi:hypothetical protein
VNERRFQMKAGALAAISQRYCQKRGSGMMRLSAPSRLIFLLSVILVALVILSKYFGVEIPVLTTIVARSPFEILLVAWALLFLGVTFRL